MLFTEEEKSIEKNVFLSFSVGLENTPNTDLKT